MTSRNPPELINGNLLLRFLERVSIQAALIAGFAFAAFAEVLSTSAALPYWRGMFFSTTTALSICLEGLVLFFYLHFALVRDDDLRHYTAEVVAFNWIHLVGLFCFGLSFVALATIYLQRSMAYVVTAIVTLFGIVAVVLIVRMSLKVERIVEGSLRRSP